MSMDGVGIDFVIPGWPSQTLFGAAGQQASLFLRATHPSLESVEDTKIRLDRAPFDSAQGEVERC